MYYYHMFTDPLTSEDLYWIGYLRADGNLEILPSGNLRVRFSQKYIEPIESLKLYINGKTSIYIDDRDGHEGYQFSFTKHASILAQLGFKEYLREDIYASLHFWRGMLDGDGCIYLPDPLITLSGSFLDLTKFSTFVANLLDCNPRMPTNHGSIYQLAYRGNKAICAVCKIYGNHYSALPYKRKLAEQLMLRPLSSHGNAWQPNLDKIFSKGSSR